MVRRYDETKDSSQVQHSQQFAKRGVFLSKGTIVKGMKSRQYLRYCCFMYLMRLWLTVSLYGLADPLSECTAAPGGAEKPVWVSVPLNVKIFPTLPPG